MQTGREPALADGEISCFFTLFFSVRLIFFFYFFFLTPREALPRDAGAVRPAPCVWAHPFHGTSNTRSAN